MPDQNLLVPADGAFDELLDEVSLPGAGPAMGQRVCRAELAGDIGEEAGEPPSKVVLLLGGGESRFARLLVYSVSDR